MVRRDTEKSLDAYEHLVKCAARGREPRREEVGK